MFVEKAAASTFTAVKRQRFKPQQVQTIIKPGQTEPGHFSRVPALSKKVRFSLLNLDVFAVSREVDLDDEPRDVLTVTDPVEGRTQRKVVEVHSTFNWTYCEEPIVWTEPEPQESNQIKFTKYFLKIQ